MKQSVIYDNQKAVEKALQKLESLPPLVTPTEVGCRRIPAASDELISPV